MWGGYLFYITEFGIEYFREWGVLIYKRVLSWFFEGVWGFEFEIF